MLRKKIKDAVMTIGSKLRIVGREIHVKEVVGERRISKMSHISEAPQKI